MKFLLSVLAILLTVFSCQKTNYNHEASVVPVFDEGLLQSPINIYTKDVTSGKHDISAYYQPSHELITHLEHTIEVDYDQGSTLKFDNQEYVCKQFHFHTPSEHLIDGIRYPMEVHFVHTNTSDDSELTKYFVISVLFIMGDENAFLKEFIDNIPERIGSKINFTNKYFTLADLVNTELKDYYHYSGSLTTHPYTETVHWAVSTHILEASPDQIMKLYNMEGYNARQIQAINDREIEIVHHFGE